MHRILAHSLTSSFSYQDYSDLVTTLVNKGATTGLDQSEAMLHYTALNAVRMHRLDKTISITETVSVFLENLPSNYIWLVISEAWCGDAAQILPILHKMAKVTPAIDLRIVLRDENEALMNLFLTNGTKSIPKLLILDKTTLDLVADFGPRPTGAKQLILDYKAAHGIVDEAAKVALQKWYLEDKGISTQNEIMELMRY